MAAIDSVSSSPCVVALSPFCFFIASSMCEMIRVEADSVASKPPFSSNARNNAVFRWPSKPRPETTLEQGTHLTIKRNVVGYIPSKSIVMTVPRAKPSTENPFIVKSGTA